MQLYGLAKVNSMRIQVPSRRFLLLISLLLTFSFGAVAQGAPVLLVTPSKVKRQLATGAIHSQRAFFVH
jgi:hypothetical protein